MKGLDLSEEFYWEIVRPLIARRFPQLMEKHAAGLIGYGSDVLGYDDVLSRDHEWGRGATFGCWTRITINMQ